MARKKIVATSTPFPQNVPLSKPIPQIEDGLWDQIGAACAIIYDINLGNRAALDRNLDIWNAILEMRSTPLQVPWPGASHLVSPTVFTAYMEFVSRVVGSVLQPRPYSVRGNDPISSQYANSLEQFYNAEFDQNECFDAYDTGIRYGARDGTAFMEVMYDLTTHQELYDATEPVTDAQGQMVMGPGGLPKMRTVEKLVTFVDYDAPREEACDLKSVVIAPNFATDINKADGYFRKLLMNEHDFNKKIASKIFRADIAESVLRYVSEGGQGEQSTDPQGNSQYTISGMINVVDVSVAPPDGVKMSRGPCEVLRFITNLFDLNGDGIPEENIIWFHYNSRKMLGFAPFDYMGGRPLFPLAMIPRPGLLYGFSIPEIGRSTQEEVDTQTNSRLNLLDLAVKPPRYRTQGVRMREDSRRWEPDVEIEMNTKDDYGFIDTPPIPQGSMVEEQSLTGKLDRAIGSPQATPDAIPLGGQQQRSARAAQIDAAIKAMQSNLVILRTRRWMHKIFKYKHGLYLRYGKDELETVQQTQEGAQKILLPKAVLALDFTLGINGMGGTLDKETKQQNIAMVTQLMLDTPLSALFQGRLDRLWNLARLNLETMDMPDVTTIIGTLDEANAQMKQMQDAAQGQAQFQALMQILSHQPAEAAGRPPAGQPAPRDGGTPPAQRALASMTAGNGAAA